VIALRAVEKWTVAFDGERARRVVLPRLGRPRDTGKVDVVSALIEGEGCRFQKKIAPMLGVHHETIEGILRDDLNICKVNFNWMPHTLDSSQKASWVQVSRQLLDFLESRADRNLSNVYTGDETWLYVDNPWASMSIATDVTRRTGVRSIVASKKRMFWIEFSRTGIGAVRMPHAGQSLNKDFFTGTGLESVVDERALSRPKWKVSGTLLPLDSARPRLTSDKYDKFRIKRLPHPPYSPDLAPCAFWPFEYLKDYLDGKFFDDDIELEGAVSDILMLTEPDMFVRVFAE
jgi:histone-lysine N-methyltransferase SETMAR